MVLWDENFSHNAEDEWRENIKGTVSVQETYSIL